MVGRRQMTEDGIQTTPGIWHNLPTGELTITIFKEDKHVTSNFRHKTHQYIVRSKHHQQVCNNLKYVVSGKNVCDIRTD